VRTAKVNSFHQASRLPGKFELYICFKNNTCPKPLKRTCALNRIFPSRQVMYSIRRQAGLKIHCNPLYFPSFRRACKHEFEIVISICAIVKTTFAHIHVYIYIYICQTHPDPLASVEVHLLISEGTV